MAFVDYYKVLGLSKDATLDDIEKTCHKLTWKCHPNLNPDDKEAHKQFRQLNEVSEVLSDADMLRMFAQYGAQYGERWKQSEEYQRGRAAHEYVVRQEFPGGWDSYRYTQGQQEGDFSDFFESVMGKPQNREEGRTTIIQRRGLAVGARPEPDGCRQDPPAGNYCEWEEHSHYHSGRHRGRAGEPAEKPRQCRCEW